MHRERERERENFKSCQIKRLYLTDVFTLRL